MISLLTLLTLLINDAFSKDYVIGIYPSVNIGHFGLMPASEQQVCLDIYIPNGFSFRSTFGAVEGIQTDGPVDEPYFSGLYGIGELRFQPVVGKNLTIGPGGYYEKIYLKGWGFVVGLFAEGALFTNRSQFPLLFGLGLGIGAMDYSDAGIVDLHLYSKIPLGEVIRLNVDIGVILRAMVGIEMSFGKVHREIPE
jgi:hypothetical protein